MVIAAVATAPPPLRRGASSLARCFPKQNRLVGPLPGFPLIKKNNWRYLRLEMATLRLERLILLIYLAIRCCSSAVQRPRKSPRVLVQLKPSRLDIHIIKHNKSPRPRVNNYFKRLFCFHFAFQVFARVIMCIPFRFPLPPIHR